MIVPMILILILILIPILILILILKVILILIVILKANNDILKSTHDNCTAKTLVLDFKKLCLWNYLA